MSTQQSINNTRDREYTRTKSILSNTCCLIWLGHSIGLDKCYFRAKSRLDKSRRFLSRSGQHLNLKINLFVKRTKVDNSIRDFLWISGYSRIPQNSHNKRTTTAMASFIIILLIRYANSIYNVNWKISKQVQDLSHHVSH